MGASPRSAFSTRDIVNPACGQFLLNIVGSGSHVTWLFSIICDPSQAWDVLSGLAKPVHGTTSPLQPHISVIWREMWPLLAVVPNLFHGSDSAQTICPDPYWGLKSGPWTISNLSLESELKRLWSVSFMMQLESGNRAACVMMGGNWTAGFITQQQRWKKLRPVSCYD